MAKKKEDTIPHLLESIDITLKRQNSIWRTFVQGLVRGFGTALGATFLLALASSLAIQFFDSVSINTFTEYFFNDAIQE